MCPQKQIILIRKPGLSELVRFKSVLVSTELPKSSGRNFFSRKIFSRILAWPLGNWWQEGLWSDLKGGCRQHGGEKPWVAEGWWCGEECSEVRACGHGTRWGHPHWPLWAWTSNSDVPPQLPQAQQIPNQTKLTLVLGKENLLPDSLTPVAGNCIVMTTHIWPQGISFDPSLPFPDGGWAFPRVCGQSGIRLFPKNLVLSRTE